MKKKKVFKIIAILSLIITIIILAVSLYLNISEIIDMKQCACTPGCMYCIPGRSIIAYLGYIISFITFINTVVFFSLYKNK